MQTKALKKSTKATQKAAKATEKGMMRGTAEAATEALEKTGVKASDDLAGEFSRLASKFGCAGGCERLIKELSEKYGKEQVEDMFSRSPRRLAAGKADFPVERQHHILTDHRLGSGPAWKKKFDTTWSNQKILDAAESVADNPVLVIENTGGRAGCIAYGIYDGVEIKVVINQGGIWTAYPKPIPWDRV